ncbi:uncharacterized protein LOC34620855 [Cyclospora cayetanensis]|uniref:Uncharacterized protein LOC34620855 n=1 Tax=Cyclospora cayetanensis TaxID=88456 RepID=A0A6P6RTM9_9EIME|nr:uncharacterized protein LOC34620855 [Cyclospora cayetanensis]
MMAQLQKVDELLLQQKDALLRQEREQNQKETKWKCQESSMQHEDTSDPRATLTPRMSFERQLTDVLLKELLEKMFEAADEDKTGHLQHREVAALLFACPLGLSKWEGVQLLAAAHEDPEGWIDYAHFMRVSRELGLHGIPGSQSDGEQLLNLVALRTKVNQNYIDVGMQLDSYCLKWLHNCFASQNIPKLLDLLRDRREKAQLRLCRQTVQRVTTDAVLLLYKEEIEETFRYSRQDKAFIMQTVPGNDRGDVEYAALPTLLHILRRESVNNSVLEVDKEAIKEELTRVCVVVACGFAFHNAMSKVYKHALACTATFSRRRVCYNRVLSQMGTEPGGLIPVWTLRDLLDKSDLCLSRMHIHVRVLPQVLLSLTSMNRQGQVEWSDFVEVVQRVLPLLFDTNQISKLVADAEAQAEFEELRGLSATAAKQKQRASLAARRRSKSRAIPQIQMPEQVDDSEQGDAPDRESVEKTLAHLFTVLDDRRKGSVPAHVFVGVMHYWTSRGGVHAPETGGISLPTSATSAGGGAALAAERRYADIVLSCRLTPSEVTGFVAEAKVDPHAQEISYAEHIKGWIGSIFEIR